jgi:peptide deformylase
MADENLGEHGQGHEEPEPLDPEREARRRLALAQIRQYPDPVLRMRAKEVESFDRDLRRLVERMTQLMQDASGVGLAGTQVGTLQRVFVLQAHPDDEPQALVNPEIVARSEETLGDAEGCLSLQGVSVPVERALKVTIEAKDEQGKDVRLELEEHAARVAQHELDHLDGVLIVDRTTPEARREALGILRPVPLLGALG